MERVTKEMMNGVLARYVRACESLGIKPPKDHHIAYIEGSKTYGNSYKLVYVHDKSGGHHAAPGTTGGYLGMTKREALDSLLTICLTMEDVNYFQSRRES